MKTNTNTLIMMMLGTLLLITGSPLHAALPLMMKLMINGQEIEGGVTRQGYVKWILVYSLSQETSVPYDQGKGGATGHRTHHPLIITKEIDKASPLLMKALANQERIDAVIRFLRPTKTGDEKEFYEIKIQDGRVLAVNHIVRDTMDPPKMQYPPIQEVSFGYQNISWTWLPDGTKYTDGTLQPMSGMMGGGDPSQQQMEPGSGTPPGEHRFREGEMIKGIATIPVHPQGWCCANGNVFFVNAPECEKSGGVLFSPDKNEVQQHCSRMRPPGPREMSTGEPAPQAPPMHMRRPGNFGVMQPPPAVMPMHVPEPEAVRPMPGQIMEMAPHPEMIRGVPIQILEAERIR